jgi:hypothetical protein
VRVRRAPSDEIEVVLAVLADAAAWLRTRGVAQWPDRLATDWVMPARYEHVGDVTVDEFTQARYEKPVVQ